MQPASAALAPTRARLLRICRELDLLTAGQLLIKVRLVSVDDMRALDLRALTQTGSRGNRGSLAGMMRSSVVAVVVGYPIGSPIG